MSDNWLKNLIPRHFPINRGQKKMHASVFEKHHSETTDGFLAENWISQR